MSEEIWKDIPGYEGKYQASNMGRIFSVRRRIILKTSFSWNGYYRVRLCQSHNHSVHRLVLRAFVGPCPSGHEAGHLNGNKADNRPENLSWVTRSENEQHKFAHGTRGNVTHCKRGHLLSGENIRMVKKKDNGSLCRLCLSCARIRQANRLSRSREQRPVTRFKP